MIDLNVETPIPLSEAEKLRVLSRLGKGGGPVKAGTLWKWIRVGVRGVKLEWVQAGVIATTEPAIIRFLEKLTHPHLKDGTSAAAVRSHRVAANMLDRMGV